MGGFLSDIRVLDVGSFVAGPAAATVMGDFGADVIKVEPFEGDAYRTLLAGSPVDYFWLLDSRNKRSLALDIKSDEGHAVLRALIERADVFVTNYRGSLLDRLKLGHEALCAQNPRLIYAHVSGYGTEGPEAERTAFDTTAWWGRSGLQDFVRGANGPATMSAPGMGDHATAMSLFGAIMAALYRRTVTGRGGYVSTSLVANGAWSHGMVLQAAFGGTDWVAVRERGDATVAPLTHLYRTLDGRWLHLCVLNPAKEWANLTRLLGHPEWAPDERFASAEARRKNGALLAELIGEAMSRRTLAELRTELDSAGVTYGYAALASELADDAQLRANGVVVTTGGNGPEYRYTIGSPVTIDGETKRIPAQAPRIGQHTFEVLRELGHADETIEGMIARGVAKA